MVMNPAINAVMRVTTGEAKSLSSWYTVWCSMKRAPECRLAWYGTKSLARANFDVPSIVNGRAKNESSLALRLHLLLNRRWIFPRPAAKTRPDQGTGHILSALADYRANIGWLADGPCGHDFQDISARA